MKNLSTAFIALSLLTAASAVHAQSVAFGTNFDGSNTFPYDDPGAYLSATQDSATGPDLNAQHGWTATPGAVSVFNNGDNGTTGNPITPATDTFATVFSPNGTASASHAFLSGPTTDGFNFSTDAQILDARPAVGNTFSFNFASGGVNIFSVNFTPSPLGEPNAPTFTLTSGNGTTLASQPSGPAFNQFFHLTVSVSSTGTITASLGTPGSTITDSSLGALASTGISSFGFSESGASGAGDLLEVTDIAATIPEPSTYAMMGLGLVGMLGLMKFRRSKVA